ncbi:MAG: hypothetical protein PVH88_21705 [Ignavibacteria bacterium]|jgi:aminoglycoside/choline kinase family phosphotransferase
MIHIKKLKQLFENWSCEEIIAFEDIPETGSYRKYYRIKSKSKTAIGVYNNDARENTAFITITTNFSKKNLRVPSLYKEDIENNIYLVEDLGDINLCNFFNDSTKSIEAKIKIYKKTIDNLIELQLKGLTDLDLSVMYPRQSFDKQSIMWDLNYFKYYFLKLSKVHFYEQDLEDDFNSLVKYLLSTDCNYFLFRDFQSRNIMLVNNEPYFIDYQGGRKGALQYDIASLLFDANVDLSELRDSLLSYYINKLNEKIKINKEVFIEFFYGYSLTRLLQMLGAFGFRGKIEKKPHFEEAIPQAIENLKSILSRFKKIKSFPCLNELLNQIVELEI